MRRSGIEAGAKSVARGSTFSAKPSALKRTEIKPGEPRPGRARNSTLKQGAGFAASPAQRAKVKGRVSIVSGDRDEDAGGHPRCDPAHVWPRGLGGCDDALCVVPLTRAEHDAFDAGELELLPHLVAHRCFAEIAHAVEHARGDLIAVLERLTAEKWQPVPKSMERGGT